MKFRRRGLVMIGALVCSTLALAAGPPAPSGVEGQAQPATDAPVVVVETTKGTFSFVTFPNEAPRTVAHVVSLVSAHFYDGQRVHRALAGFLVQFGDPQSRDLDKREMWGRGAAAASGRPVGLAEITKRRTHITGAVGMAHMGEPATADSQIYITLDDRHDLDGQYAVFGQVIDGIDVPAKLQVGDLITKMYIKPSQP
jgi:peptidyl-prolyl cis-trans isomerase B (cyclophilin B)